MKVEQSFEVLLPVESALLRARERLVAGGYTLAQDGGNYVDLIRGRPLARVISSRVETWPTRLRVRVHETARGGAALLLTYDVRTGLHLVGHLERLVLEAEAALLERFLLTGVAPSLASAVDPVRRPVAIAVMVNTLLAVCVVAVIGLYAGFGPLPVALVALAVGLLDQLTITAFADLLVEGFVRCPRLKERGRPTAGGELPPGAAETAS